MQLPLKSQCCFCVKFAPLLLSPQAHFPVAVIAVDLLLARLSACPMSVGRLQPKWVLESICGLA